MTWADFLKYTISGAVVTWPVFFAGLWLSWRKTRKHVNAVTEAQTAQIKQITVAQTAELEHRSSGTSRADRPAGEYHEHDRNAGLD